MNDMQSKNETVEGDEGMKRFASFLGLSDEELTKTLENMRTESSNTSPNSQ